MRRPPDAQGAAGARAEDIAAAYLVRRGLRLVTRNYRTRHGEIDLVMRDGDTVVFVEVRLRTTPQFGGAAASITAAKRARLVAAAEGYLAEIGREPPCRFDALLLDGLDATRVTWLQDVLEA